MQPDELAGDQTPLPEASSVLPVNPERVPFWGYSDLLLIIGLLFASLIAIGLAVKAWTYFHPETQGNALLVSQLVLYLFVYSSFWTIFRLKYDRAVLPSLGWCKTHYSLLAAAAGGVLLYFGIATLAAVVHTPKVNTPFEDFINKPFSMVLLGVTAIFLAPLFEEMVFRGFLQPLLSRTLGVALGVLLTALLFGGLHASEYKNVWQYVAAITLVGVALGAVRAKTNSIIPGTVMHGCFNAVSVVGLLAAKYIYHK